MAKHPNAAPYNQFNVLYDRTNPPPSAEDATVRLEALRGMIDDIAEALQTRPRSDFVTDEEFNAWQRRTSDARAYKETEVKYLNEWLTSGGRTAAERHTQFLRLVQLSAAQARAIRDVYQPEYSEANPPTDLDKVRVRYIPLTQIRANLEDFVTSLNRSCSEHSVTGGALNEVRKPVQKLLQQIISEHTLIVRFIRDKEGSAIERLIEMVERARSQGFEISPEERVIVETVKENIRIKKAKKF